jgi:hypothetical protein
LPVCYRQTVIGLVTDVVILAEATEQVATTKEDGPRPFAADQNALLAEVRAVTGDSGPPCDPAVSTLPRSTINTTASRAEGAGAKRCTSLCYVLLQQARSLSLQISASHTFSPGWTMAEAVDSHSEIIKATLQRDYSYTL